MHSHCVVSRDLIVLVAQGKAQHRIPLRHVITAPGGRSRSWLTRRHEASCLAFRWQSARRWCKLKPGPVAVLQPPRFSMAGLNALNAWLTGWVDQLSQAAFAAALLRRCIKMLRPLLPSSKARAAGHHGRQSLGPVVMPVGTSTCQARPPHPQRRQARSPTATAATTG